MQYQVLARKWRPQSFSELVGQEHVSRTLVNALRTGRVAHAFLFSGPRGSGKTTTARVLAKALNCHRGQPGDPCGECPACREIAAGNAIDVLEMDAASNRGIDEIRDLIENVRYHPARDRYKIFIIDEVHMLTEHAFNALLKTLEEPPAHVVFILATTEYHKIPATILSRCQQYNFKLIPFPLILERLRQIARAEGISISETSLEAVASSSGGSLRDAMSAFDQVIAFSGSTVRDEDATMLLGLVEPKLLGDTVRAVAGREIDALFGIVASLVDAGKDLQNFCRQLLGHFRNLMVLKAGVRDAAALGIPESLAPDMRAQAELFSSEDLLRLFDALLETEGTLRFAPQPRFPLEMGLVKLAELGRLRPLEDLVAEFKALVEGGGGPPATPGPKRAEPAPATGPKRVEPSSTPPPKRPEPAAPKLVNGAPPAQPEAARPAPIERNEAAVPAAGLLERIAEAIEKESLAPILLAVTAAELTGDNLVLRAEALNEFYRRQLRDNLPEIAAAARAVVGRAVKVVLTAEAPAAGVEAPESKGPTAESLLDRARQEPIVRSFLDVFPGPVKAEGME